MSTNDLGDKSPRFQSEPRVPSRSGFSGSNGIPEFPPMDSTAANQELEHKNSSLFSPLKEEASETFSSSSTAASPYVRPFKPLAYPEYQDTPPIPTTETAVQEVEGEISNSLSSSRISPLATLPSEELQQAIETTTQGASNVPMDFQAEFVSRIVHDVEVNIREVLRCRFGDLIIQSAQQFLTLQVSIILSYLFWQAIMNVNN